MAKNGGLKLTVLVIWAALLGSLWLYLSAQQMSAVELLEAGLLSLSSSPWGPLALLGMFLLRPLLLLPVTLLNVFAGYLFGPAFGFVYALLATLLSSALAYGLGRFFGQGALKALGNKRFLSALRERSFESILLARLIFLPGDLVNYASGFLKVPFGAFLGATALGGAFGLLLTVLAGSSAEGQFNLREIQPDLRYLLAASALLLVSLALSVWLRRRQSAAPN